MMKITIFLMAMFLTMNSQADDIFESALIELEVGYIGNELGIEVVHVSSNEEHRIIELDLPFVDGTIDDVRLLNNTGYEISGMKKYEVLKDHENNPTGLVLYLDKRQKKPFKLIYEITEKD